MRAIVGGWSVDTVYSFYSGQFLTPAWSGPDPTGTAYTTGTTPATVTIRPNYLHDTNLPVDQRTVSRWFDVSAFAAPTPGSFGSAAKGVIKGPGLNQWDAGIAKNIVFLETGEPALGNDRDELLQSPGLVKSGDEHLGSQPGWSDQRRRRVSLARPARRAGVPHGNSPGILDPRSRKRGAELARVLSGVRPARRQVSRPHSVCYLTAIRFGGSP